MRLPLRAIRWLHQRSLSRRSLRGSFLHSKLGDRLLDKSLWMPSKSSIARAWLIGIPITTIPFLPAQSVIAGVCGFFGRANLILCIGLQFLSTPLTAPVHLPACYFVGRVIRGESPVETWHLLMQDPGRVWSSEALFSLYLGSIVLGPVVGLIGYGVIMTLWPEHLPRLRRPRRAASGGEPVTPPDSPTS
jgi:uncharacterized protein (DUF2062 family)